MHLPYNFSENFSEIITCMHLVNIYASNVIAVTKHRKSLRLSETTGLFENCLFGIFAHITIIQSFGTM